MTTTNGSSSRHSIDDAISEYVLSRRSGHLVSVADAVHAIRHLHPEPDCSDRELAARISDLAVRSGCNVSFDCGQRRFEFPAPTPP